MSDWLYTANTKLYDVAAAMSQNSAYWPMSSKVVSGDRVFLYLSAPHKQIAYLCEVQATGLPMTVVLEHCEPFFRQAPEKGSDKLFMELRPVEAFELASDSPLGLAVLKRNGLGGMLMGPRKLDNNPELLSYIQGQIA